MKELTKIAENLQGILLTWNEYEGANRYRLEYLSDTFNYHLVEYFDKNTAFIPREKLKANTQYRIHYLRFDENLGQEFSLATSSLLHYASLETINLLALKSYDGGALSFYSEAHFDMYRVYEISENNKPQLLVESEDCLVTGRFINEGRIYQVEGYKKDEAGNFILAALSDQYHCRFALPYYQENPVLSVVIPVYNCEAFLSRTVDSVLLSALQGIEIILVNDGSKDRSAEICDWYQSHYVNVRAIHQENKGPSTARNHGMDKAKGEFLAFVDSDDIVHPYMYKKLYDATQASGTDIAIGQTISREEQNKINLILAATNITEPVSTYSYEEMIAAKGTYKNIYFVSPCNKIVRTSTARKVRYQDHLPYYEDTAYTSSLYTYIDRFTMVKGAYYIWDKRKRQTVGTYTTSYKNVSSDLLWNYYMLTFLAPLYQGNMSNPKVFECCSLNIAKDILEKYKSLNSNGVKNIIAGILKYYVREYQIPVDKFKDSQNEKLKELYGIWLDILNSDIKESNGWDNI